MDSASHAASVISPAAYWTACAIFLITFALIISEKIHKTKVALFAASATILLGILTQLEAFHSPHLGVDYNVIFLLISMMLIVNILGKSGAFEWMAVRLAKKAKGEPYTIMVFFVVATAVLSALLDNVTTVLLFAPVTLLICKELELDPVPYLIMEALASNIGGTATLIGDPPNLIVASRAQLGFMDFIVHLAPVVVILMVAMLIVTRFLFGGLKVSEEKRLQVMAMDESRLIKDPVLLKKAALVLALTITGFLLHSLLHLEPATVALAGAAILLLISRLEPHEVLAEVEWPTIFFFIGLFIVVGGIVKVGMVADLSNLLIAATQPNAESMFATSMAILWFSGILSAFVDNIPYVATMAPLVTEMAGQVLQGGASGTAVTTETLHHPVLMPVWWSLALGACLGGNGTAIGASANVVIIGLADRAGKHVSFLRFMAYGMPMMILTLALSTVYIWLRYY